ncbi:neutral zinc metallopeptidase [Nonomuraea ferruginea]
MPSRDRRGLDSFEDDVWGARTLSEEFWKQQFAASGMTYRPVNRFIPYSGTNGPRCGGQPSVPNNAFYCSAGHFIAYDEEWMRALWSRMGDGSVYLIIPHEFGHAVQAQLRTSFRLNVEMELQADCYAGGTLRALIDSGGAGGRAGRRGRAPAQPRRRRRPDRRLARPGGPRYGRAAPAVVRRRLHPRRERLLTPPAM